MQLDHLLSEEKETIEFRSASLFVQVFEEVISFQCQIKYARYSCLKHRATTFFDGPITQLVKSARLISVRSMVRSQFRAHFFSDIRNTNNHTLPRGLSLSWESACFARRRSSPVRSR